MTNDLSKFYRVPKININLPSGKNYYSEDQVQLSMDYSLPIRAMTARDELMLKSPDALLNGDCLVHIIQSCVPEIKNPKALLAPDVEAILLGIFYASYGPTIDFKAICPKCEHENNFQVEIRKLLDTVRPMSIPVPIEADLGTIDNIPTKMVAYVQPYTFETNTRHQLQLFEHSKMLQVLGDEKLADDTRLAAFNDCFSKIVNLKFENVVECITKLELHKSINGEWKITPITGKEEIREFVFNADNTLIEPIMKKVDELNETGINNSFDGKCSKCSHEWNTRVEFNPVNFFVKSSYRSSPMKL